MPITKDLLDKISNYEKQGYNTSKIVEGISFSKNYPDVAEKIKTYKAQGHNDDLILRSIKQSPIKSISPLPTITPTTPVGKWDIRRVFPQYEYKPEVPKPTPIITTPSFIPEETTGIPPHIPKRHAPLRVPMGELIGTTPIRPSPVVYPERKPLIPTGMAMPETPREAILTPEQLMTTLREPAKQMRELGEKVTARLETVKTFDPASQDRFWKGMLSGMPKLMTDTAIDYLSLHIEPEALALGGFFRAMASYSKTPAGAFLRKDLFKEYVTIPDEKVPEIIKKTTDAYKDVIGIGGTKEAAVKHAKGVMRNLSKEATREALAKPVPVGVEPPKISAREIGIERPFITKLKEITRKPVIEKPPIRPTPIEAEVVPEVPTPKITPEVKPTVPTIPPMVTPEIPAKPPAPTNIIKKEGDILLKSGIPEAEIPKYIQHTLADGEKLRIYTEDVISGKITEEEAIKKVTADYEKTFVTKKMPEILGIRIEKLKELKAQANRRAVTGLYGARARDIFLERSLKQSELTGEPTALLAIDVDNFKAINTKYGYTEANKILKHIGEVLTKEAGFEAIPINPHGDEFQIIMKGTIEKAQEKGQTIQSAVKSYLTEKGYPDVSVSIGASTKLVDGKNLELIQKDAETRLKEAKKLKPEVKLAKEGVIPEKREIAKEPYQMTQEEYNKNIENIMQQKLSEKYNSRTAMELERLKRGETGWLKTERKYEIQQALSEGKPVPAEVLADYPDLQKEVKPAVKGVPGVKTQNYDIITRYGKEVDKGLPIGTRKVWWELKAGQLPIWAKDLSSAEQPDYISSRKISKEGVKLYITKSKLKPGHIIQIRDTKLPEGQEYRYLQVVKQGEYSVEYNDISEQEAKTLLTKKGISFKTPTEYKKEALTKQQQKITEKEKYQQIQPDEEHLFVGDNFTINGEKFTIIKKTDTGITIKDGETKTIPNYKYLKIDRGSFNELTEEELSTEFLPTKEEKELFLAEEKRFDERFDMYKKQALQTGLSETEAGKFAIKKLEQEKIAQKPAITTAKAKQQELGAVGGIEGFGRGMKGEQELPITPIEKPTEKVPPEVAKPNQVFKPSEAGYIRLPVSETARFVNKYFTRAMGVDNRVNRLNDMRIGNIMRFYFDAPLTGKEIHKWIKKNGNKSEEFIYDALRGQIPIEQVPDEIRPAVQKMRDDIDSLSKTLTEQGALSDNLKVVINKNLGKYVVRAYRLFNDKYYEPTQAIKDRAKAKLKELHPKTFGKLSDEDMEGVIQSILDKRDFKVYTAGKKPITVPQNHFIKRKDIPKELRDLYGEIENPVWLYLKTITDMSVVANNSKFLNDISKIPDIYSDRPSAVKTKQIPEGKRWGQLAGKYVDDELYDFLNEVMLPQGNTFIERFIVNPFKWTKTVGNVPSHPRNFLGNITFSILADNSITNPINWKYYTKALNVIINKNTKQREMWKQLVEDGVTDVQYWGGEMPKFMDELIKLDPPDIPEKIIEWTLKKPIRFASELYNSEDQIYRVSSYLKYLDKGMTREQAGQEIDKWFTNYRKVPLATKLGRKWAVFGPFLSFKSESLRIHYNAAKEGFKDAKKGKFGKLIKLAFVLAIPGLMSEISKQIHNIDDEEIEKLNKLMPPYRRGGAMIYYRDGQGNLKAFDLTYILPLGDFYKAYWSLIRGDMEALGDSLNFFEHPLIGAYTIINEGRQPYWNYKIRDEYDPLSKQVSDTVFEVVRNTYLPLSSPIPAIEGLLKGEIKPGNLTGYQIKTIIDAYNEITDKYGRVKDLPEEIKNFLTGIRTWRVYPEIIVTNYLKSKKYDITQQKSDFRKWLINNPKATPEEREKRLSEMRKRTLKIIEDIKVAQSIKLKKL